MTTILAAFVLIVVSFVLWGVGAAIQRLTGRPAGCWPVSIGVGLAATVAAGGILNAAHIAYRPALWTLAAIELAVSVVELRRIQRWKLDYKGKAAVDIVSAALVIGMATLFAITTQLPPLAFNSHDDFEKYLAYPVRMLATGTLTGSPLSALGSETLGGQTFLHGLVLSFLPVSHIGHINGVDAVFCFAALMLLTAAAGWNKFSWFPGAVVGPLLIAAINPQYVNVSSLYSGALLMATAIMLTAQSGEIPFPSAIVLGLVYGSLVALKPSFMIFPACHLAFLLLAPRKENISWKSELAWCGKVISFAALFLFPWILLHLHNYGARGAMVNAPVPVGADDQLHLLSPGRLFYGATFLHYTAIAVLTGLIAALALLALESRIEPDESASSLALLAGAGSGAICYFATVIVLGKAFGYAQSLRLAIPFILGACVTSIVMSPGLRGRWKPELFFYFPLLASLAICASFAPSMVERYRQAARSGSILAFADLAQSPAYANYNTYWLSAAGKDHIEALQEKVPPGEPLLAWINAPFLLDYRRNRIIDADTVGLASPWAHVPENVRYVLWQYQGPEVRKQGDYVRVMQGPGYRERLVATRSLNFAAYLSQIARNSEVIAADGQFVLFKTHGQL